jgi:enamine deaminase RidA (YjgF/YER057c/UK114 family)
MHMCRIATLVLALLGFGRAGVKLAEGAECIEPSVQTGTSLAVIVDDVPLLHTGQILPVNVHGNIVEGNATRHTEQIFSNLVAVLAAGKSDVSQIVKLNVYLSRDEDRAAVQQAISRALSSAPGNRQTMRPAVSFVVGELPLTGATVALDAVARTSIQPAIRKVESFSARSIYHEKGSDHAAILPAGVRVYVSGMADTNALPVATVKTLEKLMAIIKHLDLDRSDVVQLKAFLQPMSEASAVRRIVADFFQGKAPPSVFVEWISNQPNPPIEIELIAAGKGESSQPPNSVTFVTPPGTTSSKVYSRVAQVNRGRLIYVSGLYGKEGQSGADQIQSIFTLLGEVLQKAGSDFDHLAKATYYVSDDEASNKLNAIRPEFYHPERPPAASKAKVKGVGIQGRTVTLDMIAVTK